MIRAIVASDEKRGIAANGGIPWNIPEDSRYFREQTEHGVIIMGKDTYEEFSEPLPNRRNIVVSHSLTAVRPGFELIHDVEAFLEQATEDIWIIGGAGLYTSTLGYCDELYVTHIAGDFSCDRFFPAYADQFRLQQAGDWQQSGNYRYQFAVYTKNR